MRILGNRVLFFTGIIWVIGVFIIGLAFVASHPDYYREDAVPSGILLYNIFAFALFSIPGFVLIYLGKLKPRRAPK